MKIFNVIAFSVFATAIAAAPATAIPFHVETDIGTNYFDSPSTTPDSFLSDFIIDFDLDFGESIDAVQSGFPSFGDEAGRLPFTNSQNKTLEFQLPITALGETISLQARVFWTVQDNFLGLDGDGNLIYNSQGDIDLIDPLEYFFSFGTLTVTQLDANAVLLNAILGQQEFAPVIISATLTSNGFSVPTPGALALLGIGLLGIGLRRRIV